jgi:FMN reductase (NADPH)
VNEIIEFLNSHASVRHFTEEPITEWEAETILKTAQRSPTSSNLHAYSVVSLREKAKKKELAKLTGGQEHVARCSLFLVWCADLFRLKMLATERAYDFHGGTAESFIIAVVDTALAASRALMAAQALGLGGVMVGGIRNEPSKVAELLDLPELVTPIMGMSLGHPANKAKLKPRLPLGGLHFRESYDQSAISAAVANYDTTISELGYLKGREVEAERYSGFDGDYSWSEHSARRMASNKATVMRPHMLEFLRSRGFLQE